MDDLFSVLFVWFDIKKLNEEVSSSKIVSLWEQLWFPDVDNEKQAFDKLKEFDSKLSLFVDYEPKKPLEKIALIILYDQIPRSLYRNEPKAYQYDEISRKIALEMLDRFTILPLHFQITVLVSIIHSEDIEHQKLAKENLAILKENPKINENIFMALNEIHKSYVERIENFGRLPERSLILNRELTEKERNYLKGLGII